MATRTVFSAGSHVGRELWITDGTPEGTVLLKDIYSGSGGSNPKNFFLFGNKVLFAASNGQSGFEPWITDGTAAGTFMLKDIVPGVDPTNPFAFSSEPEGFTLFNGKVYFAAGESGNRKLWVTDGTPEGTLLVKDVRTDPNMIVLGDKLLFVAGDASTGLELWVSDGTTNGTMPLKDIAPGTANSLIGGFTVFGDKVLFRATDGVNGTELWVTDGTAAGTVMVKDIRPGSSNSGPAGFTVFGDKVLFSAHDDANGRELWITDGTTAGTVMLKDIFPGPVASTPNHFFVFGDKVLFAANDGVVGNELWVTDGTAAGTMLFKDLYPGDWTTGSNPAEFTRLGDNVVFRAFTREAGWELWITDGTAAGTMLVKDIFAGIGHSHPGDFETLGATALFTAREHLTGSEPWVTDGTAAGTFILKDIYPGSSGSDAGGFTTFVMATEGSGGDDNIPGTGDDEVINGGDGNDTIDGGAGHDTINGGAGNDTIDGGTGHDRIDGGTGADTMRGGPGNDVYFVDETGDQVIENENEGIDEIRTTLSSYVIPANVENLVYIGSGHFSGTGNALANTMRGGAGFDVLAGGAGDDLLDLRDGGEDVVFGEDGDDRFYFGAKLSGSDYVQGGPGTDALILDGSYGTFGAGATAFDLGANVLLGSERLTLLGAANAVYDGTAQGTNRYNLRTSDGHVAAGAMLTVDASNLASSETLRFDGSAETDGHYHVIGGKGADTITTGAGNDTIDGGEGADAMAGGTGDDTYVVDHSSDSVVEQPNEGTDTIRTALPVYSMAAVANVENLTGTLTTGQHLTGNGGANVITGSSGNDSLNGGGGDDTLDGGGGNDSLNGGAGADTMRGGVGNDSYQVDDPGDQVIENPDEGSDTVRTTLSSYTLGANVENLHFIGSGSFSGTGNAIGNSIRGGSGFDVLSGEGGNDSLDARDGGEDVLFGGDGNDTFWMGWALSWSDYINGGAGTDTLYLHGFYGSPSAPFEFGPNVLIDVEQVRLFTNLPSAPHIPAYYYLKLNDGHVAAGATLDVRGDSLKSTEVVHFDGSAETDGRFVVVTGPANDRILTGAGNDELSGLAGDDWLDGGAGADVMTGGTGNDTYVVDNAGDQVIEQPGEGDDTVRTSLSSYTLGSNVENLVYTGSGSFSATGNSGPNNIRGGPGFDVISGEGGNDTIDARDGGEDVLFGGDGDDTFYFGSKLSGSDYVVGGAGLDQVVLQGNYGTLATPFDLGANVLIGVERLILLQGTSNAFGAASTDSYSYHLRSTDSNVAAGATLSVYASNLTASERFSFDGSAETDGQFVLVGGAGADQLRGGSGKDLLVGGGGADVYVYGAARESTSIRYDTIDGFVFGTDLIDMPGTHDTYQRLEGGTLGSASFDADMAAAMNGVLDPTEAVLFTPDSGDQAGKLFLVVDQNGTVGYQAGEDFVIELTGTTPPAVLPDFIV